MSRRTIAALLRKEIEAKKSIPGKPALELPMSSVLIVEDGSRAVVCLEHLAEALENQLL